jgi:hypothetical protein
MHNILDPLRVIIDTREQTPWAWEPCDIVCRVAGLSAGDYALESDAERVRGRDVLAVRFAIERKSFDDFLGTISTGWDRFLREMERMANFPARVIIVEGTFDQACFRQRGSPDRFGGMVDAPDNSHPMLSPSFVARRVAELTMMQVSVLFAGEPGLAAAMAYRVFLRRLEIEGMERERASSQGRAGVLPSTNRNRSKLVHPRDRQGDV